MSNITYFKENLTEQKQRGYIIASEYGGPIDVASWVLYKENLYSLPNTYAGKYAYVYEDNEIWMNDGTSWIQWTNHHSTNPRTNGKNTPDFKLLFYQYTENSPISELVEAANLQAEIIIEARLFVKPEQTPFWIQVADVNGFPKEFGTNTQVGYPSKISFRWFLNNSQNEIKDTSAFLLGKGSERSKINTKKVYTLSTDTYESGNLICVAYYDGKAIASGKLPYKNNLKDTTDIKRGMLYLTSKTPQLQRGYVMSSEVGGSIDATSSVNNTNDLRGFTNNYPGKLVYSYSEFEDSTVTDPENSAKAKKYIDGYKYFALNQGALFPSSNSTPEERIQFVKDSFTKEFNGSVRGGQYVPFGDLKFDNNVDLKWEITGEHYSKEDSQRNGIYGTINTGDVDGPDYGGDLLPREIPERHKRGYSCHYESHMFLTINGIETEIPSVSLSNVNASDAEIRASLESFNTNVDSIGCVYYRWTVYKPEDIEYYDSSDYDTDKVPISGKEDPNRTVWIRDVDYDIKNGEVVNIGSSSFDFDSDTYKPGTVTKDGQSLEAIFTNDYDDVDFIYIKCTAFFKDENGEIKSIETKRYPLKVAAEHLVIVLPDGAGSSSGIKDINPGEGTFVIDGGPTATVEDFKLEDNEYQIGYRIVHFKNQADAAANQNGVVMYLHSFDISENVSTFTLDEPEPVSGDNGAFRFKFRVTNDTSKIPFGWYRVEVFRNTYEHSLTDPGYHLYTSEPFHFFQVIENSTQYVSPDFLWLGYYNAHGNEITTNHTYRATISVSGKNLLNKEIPVVEGDTIVKKNTSSVIFSKPNNLWTPMQVNSTYTNVSGTQDFEDPRQQAESKNRNIDLYYYGEDDQIHTYSDAILVYHVLLPELDPVVDSVYKRPDGSDIFIYDTQAYTVVNPTPYASPFKSCTDSSRWINPASGVVSNWAWSYNGVSVTSSAASNPKLVVKRDVVDGFEVKAKINNPSGVITDNYLSLTGRTFSPTVYNIAVSIEQPHITKASDYYKSEKDYEIVAHVWYSTTDSMTREKYQDAETKPWHQYLTESREWTEFTDAELGENATFNWKERDNKDIWFSNTEPSTASSRKKSLSGTLADGYKNVSLWFKDNTFVKAYASLDVKVFGYSVSCAEELKAMNPIDLLIVSHKIYTGSSSRVYKNYGKTATRQLESEWIEFTVTPTLVEWFTWQDLSNTLVFMIDNEVVDENSSKYKIEYDGTRNHFYEGTFKVYYKVEGDMPDLTHQYQFSLNKRMVDHEVPVELVGVSTMNLYPVNYDISNGYPANGQVFINAKVGTSQRYILVITGTNLDIDDRFLTLKKKGFSESNEHSIDSDENEVTVGSDIFKNTKATSTRVEYYIDDKATENTEYTVTFVDAKKTNVRTARTYMFDDDSIKGFTTTSAYYKDSENPKSGFIFMKPEWINIESSFEPTVSYAQVVSVNSVVESATKYTSKVEFDLSNIGILSGSNVISKSREDDRHVFSLSISRHLDVFTSVIKNHSTDVSSTLPAETTVLYKWEHTGPSSVTSDTSSMSLNYIELSNDTDTDATDTLTLAVTILKHDATFINYRGAKLDIADYVLNTSGTYTMPKLLYYMTVNKKNINLTIGQSYSMSQVIDSIVTEVYRRDKSNNIEKTTWSGTQLDSVTNKKLVFSIVNNSSKPASISSKQVTVSSDKGCDIKIEWRSDETDTKCETIESWTSDIKKNGISISPTTNQWDLKEDPTISTTISIWGQNLKYAVAQEGDSFLTMAESGQSTHNTSFQPNITSNAECTSTSPFSFASSWTDTNHPFSGSSETRNYVYTFGSHTATFTGEYQGRSINNITFDDACVIVNKTYSKNSPDSSGISVGYTISSTNMFGPNVDIKNNSYDLSWDSAPEGSSITGKFTSSAGDAGSGTLSLSQTSLASDQNISISVKRSDESNYKVFTGIVRVAKITGISNVVMSNGELSFRVSGQNLSCATMYVANTNSSYEVEQELGNTVPTSDTSFSWNNISYNNSTYYAGTDRYIKVWIGDGDKEGQYVTYKITPEDPTGLEMSYTDQKGDSVACSATSGTISWKGTVYAVYSDGSKKLLKDNQDYSQSVEINKNCCTTSSRNVSKTVTWTYTYGDLSDSKNISASISQAGDNIVSTSISYADFTCPSSVANNATSVSVTTTATPIYTWESCSSTTSGTPYSVTDTATFESNAHSLTAKTFDVTLFGKTCTITQGAGSIETNNCTYTSLDKSSGNLSVSSTSVTVTAKGTYNKYWEDGTLEGTYECSDTCTQTFDSNVNKSTTVTISGTCHDLPYSFVQDADVCEYKNTTFAGLRYSPADHGTTPGCGNWTRNISTTKVDYYSYKYGGESCDTKVENQYTKELLVYTDRDNPTFTGVWEETGYTYSFIMSGEEGCEPQECTYSITNLPSDDEADCFGNTSTTFGVSVSGLKNDVLSAIVNGNVGEWTQNDKRTTTASAEYTYPGCPNSTTITWQVEQENCGNSGPIKISFELDLTGAGAIITPAQSSYDLECGVVSASTSVTYIKYDGTTGTVPLGPISRSFNIYNVNKNEWWDINTEPEVIYAEVNDALEGTKIGTTNTDVTIKNYNTIRGQQNYCTDPDVYRKPVLKATNYRAIYETIIDDEDQSNQDPNLADKSVVVTIKITGFSS